MTAKNRWKGRLRKAAAAALACVMLISCLGLSAMAATGSKNATTRAIAIVFDNSGSMYMNQNKAWCRATYAIEVFASMMNAGDTLQVYPMYEVTVNGVTYTSQNPFTISGGDDTSVIQTMYTPFAGDTPIETIGDAYNGLKKINADEQWLIVLTDGAVFYENQKELQGNATKKRLEEVLTQYNQDVNVLYLGIDPVAVIPQVADNGAYQYHTDKASDSRDTLTKLTEMCNMIFGRDVLAKAGKEMTFDVSMKKLILFVQGSDISNVTLKNSSGASVGNPTQYFAPRYGELGAGTVRLDGKPLSFSVDKSLSGYIAVYDTELDAGTYSLSYSGDVDSVSVYYEPDIDLAATLTDQYGAEVDPTSEMYPGTYKINYGLVDKSGNTTTSDLLGKTSYTVAYSINGVEKVVKNDQSGYVELQLKEGDTLEGRFSVTYLSGYTINKNSTDFNWPFGGLKIVPRPAGLLEMKVSGGQKSYNLSQLDNPPFHVQLIYEGVPLTAAQLANANVTVDMNGANVGYKLEPSGDGFALSLGLADVPGETSCGRHKMRLSASYTNEFGVTSKSNQATVPFEIKDDGYRLKVNVEGDSYFVISKLDESDPIKVVLSADGKPLTDEQLAKTVLTVDGDGLTCESKPLPGQSAFEVRIVKDDAAKAGHYDLKFTAASLDQVGRPISDDDSQDVELSTYPLWLRYLVIALIIALIATLIWLYMNMKVLPKKITVNTNQTAFTVDGETVTGAARCQFSGGGKKTGSIHVESPAYTTNPLVKGGFKLELEAVSPRRVKSSKRRVKVVSITPVNTPAVQTLSVGTHTLAKVVEDQILWMYDGKQMPNARVSAGFEMGGKPNCSYIGETPDDNATSFMLAVQLLFK